MKKIFIMVVIMALTCLNTLHQADAQTQPKAAATAAKTVTVMGTVSADEKSFVGDKDNKSWTVVNPEALKGHAGLHVSITAQVDAAKDEVTVKSVKMKTLENNDTPLLSPALRKP
jgi:hypothetical protein